MSAPMCDASSFDRFAHPWLPVCHESGPHFCLPRAVRACGFFERCLVHTKGLYARKPFVLAPWQRDDIIGPLFGEVIWSQQYRRFVRRFRTTWIELARKQGKASCWRA